MNKFSLSALTVGVAALLNACAPLPASDEAPAPAQLLVSAPPVTVSAPASAGRFVAVGYGAISGNYASQNNGQQKLMAMRAARLDAYRNLAEQVYGFRIWGNTSVSAFSAQNDNIRSYVDAFIKGARLINMSAMSDGTFEATVEMELTPAFTACVTGKGACQPPALPANTASASQAACSSAGCVQPSSYYTTH